MYVNNLWNFFLLFQALVVRVLALYKVINTSGSLHSAHDHSFKNLQVRKYLFHREGFVSTATDRYLATPLEMTKVSICEKLWVAVGWEVVA